MKSPRKYTAREKLAAIRRTLEVGPAAASKELGIASGTLSCWAHKARQGVPGGAIRFSLDSSHAGSLSRSNDRYRLGG